MRVQTVEQDVGTRPVVNAWKRLSRAPVHRHAHDIDAERVQLIESAVERSRPELEPRVVLHSVPDVRRRIRRGRGRQERREDREEDEAPHRP